MNEEEKDGERRGRIDLSVSQVVGGGLATLAAATAASYLNVYGTIIGAAVMSVLSTAAAPVIQHLFTRGGDRARGLAGNRRRPGGATTAQRGTGAPDDPTGAAPGEDAGDRARDATSGDGDAVTELMRVPGHGETETTRALPIVDATGAGTGDPDTRPSEGGHAADDRADGAGGWWRRWRRIVIPAAAVFVLVMLVILAFELVTGRSLSDTVHGSDTPSGPSLLGGQEQPRDRQPAPRPTPAPETGAPDDGASHEPPQDPDQPDRTDQRTEAPDTGTEPTADPGTPDPGGDTGTDQGGETGDDSGTDTGGQTDTQDSDTAEDPAARAVPSPAP